MEWFEHGVLFLFLFLCLVFCNFYICLYFCHLLLDSLFFGHCQKHILLLITLTFCISSSSSSINVWNIRLYITWRLLDTSEAVIKSVPWKPSQWQTVCQLICILTSCLNHGQDKALLLGGMLEKGWLITAHVGNYSWVLTWQLVL